MLSSTQMETEPRILRKFGPTIDASLLSGVLASRVKAAINRIYGQQAPVSPVKLGDKRLGEARDLA